MIAAMTREKYCLMTGRFPNRRPAMTKRQTQRMARDATYRCANSAYRILPIATDTGESERLARQYVEALGIPEFAYADALHIALAVLGNMDYLATWNCSHIANGATIARLLEFHRAQGLCECVICTPEELMEGEP